MMKKLYIFFFIFSPMLIHAQFTKDHLLYVDYGISAGNYIGGEVHLNYIHKQKLSLQIGFYDLQRKDLLRPENYNGGPVSIFYLGESNPKDKLKSYSFLVGKILPYKGYQKARWNLRAGLTYSSFKEPINYIEIDSGLFGANYTFEYEKSKVFGVIIKPELEVAFFKNIGTGLSGIVCYNEKTIHVGLELVFKFGFVGASK
ncbi:hypothetical protein [Labilibaculum manganireducens]|uniref:hypothetical protein n=1 Tax=Labilibaculum manganireducens TaxID=1940525 RepID=UPI0029F583D4|nr:hypothetical protein [Labilibaculum manganireducens]